jgi:hypothetical protein
LGRLGLFLFRLFVRGVFHLFSSSDSISVICRRPDGFPQPVGLFLS